MEVSIGLGLLAILGFMTIFVLKMTNSVWQRSRVVHEVLSEFQVFKARLEQEVQESNFVSSSQAASGAGETLAFLSPRDSQGVFLYDNSTLEPTWQKYIVYYHEHASRQLLRREIALLPGSPETSEPRPIEVYDQGGSVGTRPLGYFRTGGRTLMRDVDSCQFQLINEALVCRASASGERYGKQGKQTLDFSCRIYFRNSTP